MWEKILQLTSQVKKLMTLISVVMLSCVSSNAAQALAFTKISQVYFFGDSLTDSGFNDLFNFFSTLPTGKAPTFTTYGGYTWAQYVARDIKGFILPQYPLPIYPFPNPPDTITNNTTPLIPGTWPVSGLLRGVDYAAGGSTTNSLGVAEIWAPSLHQQIARHLATATPILDPHAVYFIWSGANDLLKVIASGAPTELQLLIASNLAAINIASEVGLLSARGAKRVVVLSLPNIGHSPFINQLAATTHSPTLPGMIKTISFTFNSMLNQQLSRVSKHTKILYIDVFDLLDRIIMKTMQGQPFVVAGQPFLFVNFTQPACGNVPTAIFCPPGAPNNYIFADSIHPTDMAHRVLSLYVETQILKWK